MEFKLDVEKFEERQVKFIEELIKEIIVKTREAGLEGDALENLSGSIALSIASMIDDTSKIEVDGLNVQPYLTFRSGDDEIVHCGENSYTYEYVRIILNRLFSA